MKPSLFITGAGGFVGRNLLAKLDRSKYKTIYCLSRKMENVSLPVGAGSSEQFVVIEGDILDINSYDYVLHDVDTVIHLAALTGKAAPQAYFKVNAYGTMLLLDRCKRAGVKHFLFVSTIAAQFKNQYRYFYAQSKVQAETYVKDSGLNYTILRPTIILGKGSPVFAGLAMLAGLPVIPVFGQGDVEVQPVDVSDVAKAITRIESHALYKGDTYSLGGPETITIAEFLQKIAAIKGKEKSIVKLPITIIIFFLAILERVVYRFLPLTVGQLATFRNDGCADNNILMKKLSPMMVHLEAMIAAGLIVSPEVGIVNPETEKLAPDTGIVSPDTGIVSPDTGLDKGCRVFCHYLTGMEPNAYILKKYYHCHETIDFEPKDFHDRLLLKLARKGFFLTRMADVYSRFFRPNSTLRKKLAYLTAILEVSPPYFRFYDTPDRSGKPGLFIKLGLKGFTLALHLLVSFIFLFPLQLISKLKGKTK